MTERITCPVSRHGQEHGDKIALVSNNRSLTYQQLNDAINLKQLDVRPRERVALIAPNSIEYIVTLFALWRRGAVACLLSTRLPEEGILACLKAVSCTRTLKGDSALFFIDNQSVKKGAPFFFTNAPSDIMFTSGSSGDPKAAVHTFGNHYYSALGANEHVPVGPGDRWLLSLPLYHVGGLGIIWRTFLAGGTVVIPDIQTALTATLHKFNITHVSLVPTQLHRFLSNPKNIPILQRMKAILVGGSPIPDALILRAVDAGLPVYLTYGLTETASQAATSSRLTQEEPLPAAKPLRYSEVRVAPDNEILVRGKTLFAGYWCNGRVDPSVDKDGWFATGDLGCLNADGTLTVLGRKDNMFISGGENIQPEEIERYLCHIKGIVQAMVVPVKSEEFGARPVAFVEIKEGAQLSKSQILSSLRQCLPSFKLPDQIYSWPSGVPERGMKSDRPYFIRLAQTQTPAPTVPL